MPENPILTFSLTGTGTRQLAQASWGNDYVSLVTPDRSRVPLHVRSDDRGNFELFLPDSVFYELSVFDPDTGLIGHETGITSPSGQRTTLAGSMVFAASTEPDSDFDGLPDDVERHDWHVAPHCGQRRRRHQRLRRAESGVESTRRTADDHGRRRRPGAGRQRLGHCPNSRRDSRRPANRLCGARPRGAGRRGHLAFRSADSAGPARPAGQQRGRGSRTCRRARSSDDW